jgi:hypothetical protein
LLKPYPIVYPHQPEATQMPAKPKLRKKKVGKSAYWFTKAGGET